MRRMHDDATGRVPMRPRMVDESRAESRRYYHRIGANVHRMRGNAKPRTFRRGRMEVALELAGFAVMAVAALAMPVLMAL